MSGATASLVGDLFVVKHVDAEPEEVVRLSEDGVLTVNLRALGWRPSED